jgi:predicted amidohydrolase YtcJ
MRTKAYLISLVLLITINSCIFENKTYTPVDLIIHNAVIYTVDSSFTIAQSMAIDENKIIDIGSNKDILNKYSANHIIDLEGKFVYPGFIDPHGHYFGYSKSLLNADLYGSKSFEEVISIIKDHHEKYPSEWILGRGWDQNEWPVKEFPNRKQLDEVFPDTPVLLRRVDGHAAIANSEALRRAGIKKAHEISGGLIQTHNSELTGILIGNAIHLVDIVVPKAEDDVVSEALLNAQNNLFAVGLTSIGDAGLDKDIILKIDSLQKNNSLKLKIYAMLSPTEENFEHFVNKGHYKTDRLSVRSVKLFADGALGSRGAKLLEPYSDDPGNTGIHEDEPEFIREIAQRAFINNYQVNTHCIGDSAVRMILNIYGELLKDKNDLRWRIEHAQIVHPDDFELFGKYNIIPSMQAIHATSDMLWAIDRLGKERLKNSYALKKLMHQNGWIPNSSDFPIEPINPLFGFYAAVERKNFDNIPEEGFQMENALSREEALKAMTIWAAKAQFEEDEKGSLEVGKTADFVVMEKDLMKIPAKEILSLRILKTYINGEKVFDAK